MGPRRIPATAPVAMLDAQMVEKNREVLMPTNCAPLRLMAAARIFNPVSVKRNTQTKSTARSSTQTRMTMSWAVMTAPRKEMGSISRRGGGNLGSDCQMNRARPLYRYRNPLVASTTITWGAVSSRLKTDFSMSAPMRIPARIVTTDGQRSAHTARDLQREKDERPDHDAFTMREIQDRGRLVEGRHADGNHRVAASENDPPQKDLEKHRVPPREKNKESRRRKHREASYVSAAAPPPAPPPRVRSLPAPPPGRYFLPPISFS